MGVHFQLQLNVWMESKGRDFSPLQTAHAAGTFKLPRYLLFPINTTESELNPPRHLTVVIKKATLTICAMFYMPIETFLVLIGNRYIMKH